MAFSPNWINPNTAEGASGPWQHQIVCDAGSGTYYVLLDNQLGQLQLYKSTDDLATASLLSTTCPITFSANAVIFLQLIGGVIRVTYAQSASQTSAIVKFTEYDIAGNTWSAVSNIGGSFNQNQSEAISAAQQCAGLFRFKRRDGSTVLIYQQLLNTPNRNWQVHILQEVSGTWTQIGTFAGDPTNDPYYILYSCGINPVTDRIYGFMNHMTQIADSVYDTNTMEAFVIDTDNTISSALLVEGAPDYQELMPYTDPAYSTANCLGGIRQPIDSSENGRVAFSSDGNTVAFAWGVWTNFNICGDSATNGIHVAMGDLTTTPLNPSWTVEVAASLTPVNWNGGFSNDVNVTFEDEPAIYLEAFGTIGLTTGVWAGWAHHTGAGTGIKVYWGSYTTPSGGKRKIYWSRRSGTNTWSAKAILYPDPDTSAIQPDGFDIPVPFVAPPVALSLACPVSNAISAGVPYSGTLVRTGGTGPFTFAITAGALPPGFSLNTSTGAITGTTSAIGSWTYTAQVTDSLGATAHITCTFVVGGGGGGGGGTPCQGVVAAPSTDNQFELTRVVATLKPASRLPVRGRST